jgi:hypothetical protein
LAEIRTRALDAKPVALGPLENLRQTPEAAALYSSVRERPDQIDVRVHLKAARFISTTTYAVLAATALAGAGALLLKANRELADNLAILVLPTTVAATLVLIREQTSLATRLLQRSRAVLGVVLLLTWVLIAARVVYADGGLAWVETLDERLTDAARQLWQFVRFAE